MKEYLYTYIEKIEKELEKKNLKDRNELKQEMLIKIGFFQHERFIHLIITLFYAVIFLIFLVFISLSAIFIVPTFILMIFLICYIIHYFRLENGTQYLYKLYDKINSSTDKPKK